MSAPSLPLPRLRLPRTPPYYTYFYMHVETGLNFQKKKNKSEYSKAHSLTVWQLVNLKKNE